MQNVQQAISQVSGVQNIVMTAILAGGVAGRVTVLTVVRYVTKPLEHVMILGVRSGILHKTAV